MPDDDKLVVELEPIPGHAQMILAMYVPGYGWLTSRRGISSASAQLDLSTELGLEAKGGGRAMEKMLARSGIDRFGRPLP